MYQIKILEADSKDVLIMDFEKEDFSKLEIVNVSMATLWHSAKACTVYTLTVLMKSVAGHG